MNKYTKTLNTLNQHDLSVPRAAILKAVEKGPVLQSDLPANAGGLSQASIGGHIFKLMQKGLVTQEEVIRPDGRIDRRKKQIMITDKGREVAEQI